MFLVAIFFCTSDSGLDNDDEQTRNFVMLERKGKKSSDVGNRTFSDSRLTTHDSRLEYLIGLSSFLF